MCFCSQRIYLLSLSFMLYFSTSGTMLGVVIASGDGSGNTSAPADDPGFANVGVRGTATAVYLGNRYVITANHVGVGSVNFGGTTYAAESGTSVRLDNPTGMGLSTKTDLVIFRLASDPGLPSLDVTTSAPSVGSDFVMIGRGRTREVDETMWDVDTNTTPNTWTETNIPPNAEATGYDTTSTRTVRWGENEMAGSQTIDLGSQGDLLSLYTQFDESGMTHEAQSVAGDSGGAVFWKDGSEWKLAGIMNAVGGPTYSGASNQWAYYTAVTFVADLSQYSDQFISLIPEPSVSSLMLVSCSTILFRRRRLQ